MVNGFKLKGTNDGINQNSNEVSRNIEPSVEPITNIATPAADPQNQPVSDQDGVNVDDMDEEAYLKFLAEAYGGADQQSLLDKFEQDKSLNNQDNGYLGVD